jgi:hypothetical protein
MIHGAPLPPDHHRVLIDCVMDDCRDYQLPYIMDDATYIADLIRILIKWPATLMQVAD